MMSSSTKQTASELKVPVPWGELRGKVWGPDNGRPVLCLHGWADNCGSFDTLIPLLPTECRYVAVDLAGHGLSSHRPPGAFYCTATYAADVRSVADALQWKTFSIIAHSMGGTIAGMFCTMYPGVVEALVLLDSYGFLPTDSEQLCKIMRQSIDETIQFEKKNTEKTQKVYTLKTAAERLRSANPSLTAESLQRLLHRGLIQVEGGVAFSRDLRVNFKNITRLSLEQTLETVSRIQTHILLILAGDNSDKFSEKAQKKFTSALLQAFRDRNHTVVRVQGDHHVHLTSPEVVAPFVCDFLRSKVISQAGSQVNTQLSKL